MPVIIKSTSERILLTRLFVDMARGLSTTYFGDRLYGSRADEIILICCIFIGQAEGKFMNASDLAEYAGIPRATALRKLSKLKKLGFVSQHPNGRFVLLPAEHLNSDEMMQLIDAVKQLIHKTSSQLLKMDSDGVAFGGSPSIEHITQQRK